MLGMRPLALALIVRTEPFSVAVMLPGLGPGPPQTSVLLLTTTPAVAGGAAQIAIKSERIASHSRRVLMRVTPPRIAGGHGAISLLAGAVSPWIAVARRRQYSSGLACASIVKSDDQPGGRLIAAV